MSIPQGHEGRGFESSPVEDLQHAVADFGSPLVELASLGARGAANLDPQVVAASLMSPIIDMRNALLRVANSPYAPEFAEFFSDLRSKAAAGSPAERLLLGDLLQ